MATNETALASHNPNLAALVASEVRAQMGRQMLSGRALARKLGTTQNWVATRIRGEVPIDLNDLQRIADALSVPWWDLLPPASSERPVQPTVRYPSPAGRLIPRQRNPRQHQPFGGSTRTRPLQDIDHLTEPNRVIPDFQPNRTMAYAPVPPAF